MTQPNFKSLFHRSFLAAISLLMLASPVKAAAPGADIFGSIQAPEGVAQYNTQAGADGIGLMVFISNLIKLLTIVAGMWVFLNLLMAGWSIITSAGDSGATKKAYDKILMSVIGLVIIVGSYTLIALVSLLLFGKADFILNPTLTGAQ